MTNFTIKVVSDNVCPWCYIGKKKLDKAIELYKKTYPGGREDTFTISWSPFYLDEKSPEQGIPIQERFTQRFGRERAGELQERLRTLATQEGIKFSFAGKLGNTRDSRRLIQLGKTKRCGEPHRDGAVLIRVGVKAGIDREEVRMWLETGRGGKEVDAEAQEAKSNEVRGVPNYTIQGKWEIHGAQDPQEFMGVFVKAKEEELV
ncbi:Uncharacterized protein YwbO [Madurella mycetomatis]|uniref:Uncharacterized protein YwbO n=1 Tax=Madurella mycetomatis TaxID=100816 RepID=A0A175VUA8_9PEZI|nr:Uncharacterized protein YwbO [Madurella mycetomatis]